jgi:hypothetical protein
LQGQSLQVLGWTHRDGTLNLTLVLPDGSRSLIPADWTDLNACDSTPTNRRPAPNMIATTSHLLLVRKVVDALLCKLNSSKHESKKASKEGRKYAKANATLGRPTRIASVSANLEKPRTSASKRRHYRSGKPDLQNGSFTRRKSESGGKP